MMGRQAEPAQLFYDFCIDDHVPANHMLRRNDLFLDLESVRQDLRPFYSRISRPSVDPKLMIRMLIVGYSFGIRSERRLCEDVRDYLARLDDAAFGAASEVTPKFVSPSDPAAQWTGALRGPRGASDEFLLAATAPPPKTRQAQTETRTNSSSGVTAKEI